MSPLGLSIALVFFVGALLTATAVTWGARSRTRARQLELQRRVGHALPEGGVLRSVETPSPSGFLGAARAWMVLQQRNAGVVQSEAAAWTRVGLAALGGVLLTAVAFSGPARALGLAAGLIPVLLLRARARKRHDELVSQLPDALDLVARSLRAGHALSDAFRGAAGEIREPLGPELATLSEQHRIGEPLRVCLDQLIERNPMVFDIRLLASAVMLQRETGANLIEILEQLAGTIREREVFTHKLAALTAEVRVSATILGALPFVVAAVLLVLSPDYLTPLVTAPLGRNLLWLGGGLMGSGLLLMRSLARVEV